MQPHNSLFSHLQPHPQPLGQTFKPAPGPNHRSDQPLRVGYVLKMYPRFSETFIVNEILAHEAAGLDIEIFSLRPPTDGRFHETLARVRAPVTYLPSHGIKAVDFWATLKETGAVQPALWPAIAEVDFAAMRDVYQAALLAQHVRERGITHLHAHFGSVATTVAQLVSRITGVPYTFTAHAKDIFHESVNPMDLHQKLHTAAAVIAVSDYNLQYLRDHYDAVDANIQRVYNGLDLSRFPYSPPAHRPRLILGVGRLIEKKGFTYLIDACAILARQGHDFQCAIIGTGELAAAHQAQIDRLGLNERVTLLGAQPQEVVIRHVQQAAVFAAPCVIGSDGNRDGLPTVLLEAMALGTPCISTDVTGIPEVLRDGATGLMVPQRDPEALAQALIRLLDDPALRVRLAGQARTLIEQQFDIHRNTPRIREIFAAAHVANLSNEEVA